MSPTTNLVDGSVNGTVLQAGHINKVEQHYHQTSFGTAEKRHVFGIVPPRAGAFQGRVAAAELIDGTAAPTGMGSRVVSGLGGVGKTQLAAEHARTLWLDNRLDVLMWVTATSRDAILSAYVQAAVTMVDSATGLNPEQGARQWLEWLTATDKRWLVVLDDLQDPVDVVGLWPPHTQTGRVVVTTRRRDAALSGDGRRIVEVGLFSREESLAFLTQRLTARPAQAEGSTELAEYLGDLPLALAQAVAYIADHRALTCTSYLRRWADRRKTLSAVLPRTSELPDEYRDTVATTWSLSIDLADRLDPAGVARPLLQIASLLDPNGIPDAVFTAPTVIAHLSAHLGREVHAEDATDALSCLQRLSLISYDPDTPDRAVRVHSLVQRAIRETTDHHPDTAIVAADALSGMWPDIERDTTLAAVLRGNADTLHTHADTALWISGAHPVLFRIGRSLAEAGQALAAIDYYDRLRATANQRLGPDHVDTLNARHHLARWQGDAGDLASAAAAFEQLLADRERLLGPDDLDTLSTRHNLAGWRGLAGDVAEAVREFQQVLADYERVLKPDHPHTLSARHNLAHWRGAAGDMTGAVREFQQVLADRERVQGPDHPHTLSARHNLAHWRGEAGDAAGAAAAFEQLLADYNRALGPDHPGTLSGRHDLARWRGEAGDVAGVVGEFEQVLADRERVLGPDHPDTVTARRNLTRWQDRSMNGNSGP